MRTKEVVEQVKQLIGDPNYAGLLDVNRAHRFICMKGKQRFLRTSRIGAVFFNASTDAYTLNLTDVDELESLYIRGGAAGTWVAPVRSKSQASPPSTAALGYRYIVADSPSGLWSAFTPGHIATAITADSDGTITAWEESTNSTGDVTLVIDEDTYYTYNADTVTWTAVETSVSSWQPLIEVSAREFEELRGSRTTRTGLQAAGRPMYYTWYGGPVANLRINPRPDGVYDVRVDYLARPDDLTDESVPRIPAAFHDLLVTLTAGYALQRSPVPTQIGRGDRFVAEALSGLRDLFDFSTRTSQSIDRAPREWLI